jgi:triacylglycerol lipase
MADSQEQVATEQSQAVENVSTEASTNQESAQSQEDEDANIPDLNFVEESQKEEETSEDESQDDDAETAPETEQDDASEETQQDSDIPEDPKERARYFYDQRQQSRVSDDYVEELRNKANETLATIEDKQEQRLQALEVERYIEKVENERQSLVNQNQQVQLDFPMFNPHSKDFNQKAYDHFLDEFSNAYLETDNNGEIIRPKASLYEYMKTKADLLGEFGQANQRKGQENEAHMRAQAISPSAGGAKSGGDSLDDLEERLANVSIV